MKKQRIYSADREWSDYRGEEYWKLLEATALMWVGIIRTYLEMVHAGIDGGAIHEAYKRASGNMQQLPIEWKNNDLRFERSRWRHEHVRPGIKTIAHCEHPWTKKVTQELVWDHVKVALARNVPHAEIGKHVAEILDARQDTVLLPGQAGKKWGLVSGKADGILVRYGGIAAAGNLIDRKTGVKIAPADLARIEQNVERRVNMARSALLGVAVSESAT